jgi:hypothetical protein
MGVTTKQFTKKPLHVEAVRITRNNFADVVKWCSGRVRTERSDAPQNAGKKFIKIEAHNPINIRQTKAFVGDWILKTERGFKVYTHVSFTQSFDERQPRGGQKSYPHMDGGFVVIGPECFAQHDGSVLSWKGTNYVPQNADRRVESEVADFDDELDSCASPRALHDPGVPQ